MGESSKEIINVDGGIRTHDQKYPWSVDDAIRWGFSGGISPFHDLEMVNQLLSQNMPFNI